MLKTEINHKKGMNSGELSLTLTKFYQTHDRDMNNFFLLIGNIVK